MGGFKNCIPSLVIDVCSRCDSDTADFGCQGIGDIIAVEIQRRYHVVCLRLEQNVLQEGIADAILDIKRFTILAGDENTLFLIQPGPELPLGKLIAPSIEAAFGELHDVALVHQGYTASLVLQSIGDRGPDQAFTALAAHRLYTQGAALGKAYLLHSHFGGEEIQDLLDITAPGLPLDARIDVLGILPKHNHVDFLRMFYG